MKSNFRHPIFSIPIRFFTNIERKTLQFYNAHIVDIFCLCVVFFATYLCEPCAAICKCICKVTKTKLTRSAVPVSVNVVMCEFVLFAWKCVHTSSYIKMWKGEMTASFLRIENELYNKIIKFICSFCASYYLFPSKNPCTNGNDASFHFGFR